MPLLNMHQWVVDTAPQAMIVVDDSGRILLANAQAEKLFEYRRDELIGKLADLLMPAQLQPKQWQQRGAFNAGFESTSLGINENLCGITKFGDVVPLEVFLRSTQTEQGRLVLASMTDISERQKQEVLLTTYRIMVESAPNAMILVDEQGRIDLVNNHTEVLFGYMREELMGCPLGLVLPVDLVSGQQGYWGTFFANHPAPGSMYAGRDLVGRTKAGLDVPVEIGFSPIETSAGTMFVVTVVDITERRRAEAALRNAFEAAETATRAKAVFLATMSHEIRTPMNAIIGMTTILLDSSLTPDQKDWTSVIRSSGEHLLTVINDILDFSKIEAGKIILESHPFSVSDCVESALDLIQVQANSKGVEVGYLIDMSVPHRVHGDISRLRQVLLNLLSNALKFTPAQGQVSLEVSATPVDDAHEIKFDVQDTGIGLSAEQQKNLFQSFNQADPSTTRIHGGTGLGLSISKRLTELMGGCIGVESEVGHGAKFTFTIVVPAAHAENHELGVLNDMPSLRGRRVLIVDDLEINRRILSHYTRTWGMVPHETGLAEEALGWIEGGNQYDLALLDFHMPHMDGLQLAHAIRRLRPESALPIVMVSSVQTWGDDSSGVVTSAIIKPVRPSRLLELLRRISMKEKQSAVAPALSVDQVGERQALRILVAEDLLINQQVLRLLFKRIGYHADFVGNGAEVLDAVERQPYDIIFMDVHMPVMDGLEATRQLCQRWSKEERPQIVGLSASAMHEDRQAGLNAGMDDYLSKPVALEALQTALQRGDRVERVAAPPSRIVRETQPPSSAFAMGPATIANDTPIDEVLFGRIVALSSCDADADSLITLVRGFLDSVSTLVDGILSGYEQGDATLLERSAHSLKSSAAIFGALPLSRVCADLEVKTRNGQVPRLTDEIVSLRHHVDDMLRAFRARFPALDPASD